MGGVENVAVEPPTALLTICGSHKRACERQRILPIRRGVLFFFALFVAPGLGTAPFLFAFSSFFVAFANTLHPIYYYYRTQAKPHTSIPGNSATFFHCGHCCVEEILHATHIPSPSPDTSDGRKYARRYGARLKGVREKIESLFPQTGEAIGSDYRGESFEFAL